MERGDVSIRATLLNYKLFAVDLDGTLLDREGRVHVVDREALLEVKRRGVEVSIITGRLYSGTRASAQAIEVLGPVVCVDGSHIVHAGTHEDLFHAPLLGDAAEAVRRVLEDHGPASFVFAHDEIVHDHAGEQYLPYVRTWSKQVVKHHQTTSHPHWEHPRGVSEVVCLADESTIRAVEAAVAKALPVHAQVAAFPLRNFENLWGMVIRAAGPTKGTAVEWLAAHHGIGTEQTVVVGDWLNDLPMFAVAGRSFAMAQAPDGVKQAATDVLELGSDVGGGVREAARRAGIL